MTSVFAGLNNADATIERLPHLPWASAEYDLEIERHQVRPGRGGKGPFFIVEAKVTQSNAPGVPEGARRSWMCDLGKESGPGNLKAYILALNPQAAANVEGAAEWLTSEANPGAGMQVRCRTQAILTKAGQKPFTVHSFAGAAEYGTPIVTPYVPGEQLFPHVSNVAVAPAQQAPAAWPPQAHAGPPPGPPAALQPPPAWAGQHAPPAPPQAPPGWGAPPQAPPAPPAPPQAPPAPPAPPQAPQGWGAPPQAPPQAPQGWGAPPQAPQAPPALPQAPVPPQAPPVNAPPTPAGLQPTGQPGVYWDPATGQVVQQ